MLKLTKIRRIAAGAVLSGLALAGLSLPAAAVVLHPSAVCTPTSVQHSTACEGVYIGNDSNQNLDGLFNLNDWVEVVKVNASSGEETRNGVTLTITNTGSSGTWAVDSYNGFTPVMFVTKGGPTFSAFLMNTNFLSGTWDNQSIVTGSGDPAGLSHFTVYATDQGGGPTPVPPPTVPLPAGLWLLMSGAGVLGGLRWKSRKA